MNTSFNQLTHSNCWNRHFINPFFFQLNLCRKKHKQVIVYTGNPEFTNSINRTFPACELPLTKAKDAGIIAELKPNVKCFFIDLLPHFNFCHLRFLVILNATYLSSSHTPFLSSSGLSRGSINWMSVINVRLRSSTR